MRRAVVFDDDGNRTFLPEFMTPLQRYILTSETKPQALRAIYSTLFDPDTAMEAMFDDHSFFSEIQWA